MPSPSSESVQDYYETGSGEETTLAENEQAWRSIRFRPRVLRDVGEVTTGLNLLGTRLAAPFLVAPTALHGLAHPDGESSTALGVAAAESLLVLSTRSSRPLEEVAASAAGRWWFQVYAMRMRRLTLRLAQDAAAAGATALVLTGDTPTVGRKHRSTPDLDPAEHHLRTLRERIGEDLTAEDIAQDPTADSSLIDSLRSATGLPVLVKGVLRADDAEAMLAAGAAGLIVSNHGGRQLDRALPTAEALPAVIAVAGGAPVLVDGGIRGGLDALAALAIGADAVLVGRPVLRALSAGGSQAVADLLVQYGRELREAMTLAGARDLGGLSRDLVVLPHER